MYDQLMVELRNEDHASSPSEGERDGEGVGDDGSSLRPCPRPRPGDFFAAFFEVFFGFFFLMFFYAQLLMFFFSFGRIITSWTYA